MKKERILLLLAPIAAVILEALPFGAVLNFARPAEDGTIGRFRQTFSYFSLTPFGYANFGPLLTALLSCTLLVMALVWCCTGRGSGRWRCCLSSRQAPRCCRCCLGYRISHG